MFSATSGSTNTGGCRVPARWLPWAIGASCILSLAAHAQPSDRGIRKPPPQPVIAAAPIALPGRSELISVFVELSPQHDAARRPALRAFVAQRGARVEHEYTILQHVINVRDISRADADRIRILPGVLSVTDDFPVGILLNDSVEQIRGTQAQINAAGPAASGVGVRVCVVDTGIDSDSVMYASRIDTAAGYDFFNNDSNPEDDNGHGSHVAGILLGAVETSADVGCSEVESFAGVAPEATLIGVKALNFNGVGLASHLVAAINHCASPTLPGGPAQVINISAGGGQFATSCDSNLVAMAANNAVAAGLVVVAAAGNSNLPSALAAPACGSQVISVGATYDRGYPNCQFPAQNFFSFCVTPTTGGCLQTCVDHFPVADQRCCFSNRSPFLDVTAPGCSIFSNDFASPDGTGLKGICGTSQATPHVAGLAALIRGFNPYLTSTEVRTIIRAGAIDLGAAGYDSSFGHGRIDVVNSLILAAPECISELDCTDALFCNGTELCLQGECVAGTPSLCDDSISCTIDDCDAISDSCRFTPQIGLCDNALFCDGDEYCDPGLGCQPGFDPCGGLYCHEPSDTCGPCATDADCDDFITCTVDSCDVATGVCSNLPNDANCDNGLFCDGLEFCDVFFDCLPGDDPCFGLHCNEPSNSCGGCLLDADCDDLVGCTLDTCDTANRICNYVSDDAACDNGLFCDGFESCDAVFDCQAAAPVDCDDAVLCTTDACNEETDACDHAPNDALCDNGLVCDGVETCSTALDCQTGTPLSCDDDVACTVDLCGEDVAGCFFIPDDTLCDNTLYCDGIEFCDYASGCQPGIEPCDEFHCDETSDICGTCVTDADCDDFISCTVDSCDVATGFCSNLSSDAACDNGLFCDGFETCDALLDCQAAAPVDCYDAVLCTTDACNEETDACDHTPNHALCDNGLVCDGVETCSTELDCQSGAPLSCDDGVACTIDLCDENVAGCFFTLDDAICDNALFCDGLETCDSTLGCLPGIPPCSSAQSCNDFSDICQPLPGAIWMSFVNSTLVPDLGAVENEDVVAYDLMSGAWSWILDGSDLGLGNAAIDGLAVLPSGDLLLSFRNRYIRIPSMVEGPGGGDRVEDSDVVRYDPTTLGEDSSGAFIFYFDGSDVGLTSDEHNVDALTLTADGFLILSIEGFFRNGKHVWTGNDLFCFIPNFLGPFTLGQFIPYFGGNSAGLGDDPGENLYGAGHLPNGGLLLSTAGPFVIATASGTNHDVLEFTTGATRPGGVPNLQLMLQPGASLGASAELSAIEYVP